MTKRKVITNGYRWTRFLMIPVMWGALSEFYINPDSWMTTVSIFGIGALCFYLISQARRLHFDDEALYIIHGKKEVVVNYKQIQSIKASKAKVNGSRFWILKYTDQAQREKTIWYFDDWYYEDFVKAIKKLNPSLVYWSHPYFHD